MPEKLWGFSSTRSIYIPRDRHPFQELLLKSSSTGEDVSSTSTLSGDKEKVFGKCRLELSEAGLELPA